MAALTADRQTVSKLTGIKSYPVLTGTTIYKGAIVAINAAGYAIPATDTAGLVVVGIADEKVVNSGASGSVLIRVLYDRLFLLPATSITQAMVGTNMVVVDDATVDDAAGATNDIVVGKLIEYVSATEGWVLIRGFGI